MKDLCSMGCSDVQWDVRMFNGMFGWSTSPSNIYSLRFSTPLLDNTLEGSKLYPVSGGT